MNFPLNSIERNAYFCQGEKYTEKCVQEEDFRHTEHKIILPN